MIAAFLYDAAYQFAVALNKTLERNEEPNGTNIISKLLNYSYTSKSGFVFDFFVCPEWR